MDKQTQNIAHNAAVIAGATFLSRILGFLRDVVIAFSLGAGPWADAFFVAFRLPNLLRRLFAEGSLTMAFVPVFTRTKQEDGLPRAFAFSRSILIWLLIVLFCITGIAILAAKPLTMLIAPGFTKNAEVFQYTVLLVRICFPYIIFISVVALCMGILNSLDHFFAPALAPCILNLILITAAFLAVWTNYSVPMFLALGVLLAGFGQWLLLQPFLVKKGFSWIGNWSLKDQKVKRVAKLMLPTVLGAAVYQINIVVITILASYLPKGSISFLYYADRLVQFPLGVFGIAVSTAALPNLSSLNVAGNKKEFIRTLNSTISLNLFISLPAMAGLIALREPLISILFVRGAFDASAAQATAWALAGYAIGLPAFCCIRSLVSGFYALEDTKTPVIIAAICMCFNFGLGFWLMQYIEHIGLAVAVSISSWINILLLGICLRFQIGSWFQWNIGQAVFIILSLSIGIGSFFTSSLGWIALALIPFWVIFYMEVGVLCRLPEAKMVQDMIWEKLVRSR